MYVEIGGLRKFFSMQKGVGRVAYDFISEGAEEVLSDLSDPLAKYITWVDKNIGENYNDVVKGLPKTFLVGGSVERETVDIRTRL